MTESGATVGLLSTVGLPEVGSDTTDALAAACKNSDASWLSESTEDILVRVPHLVYPVKERPQCVNTVVYGMRRQARTLCAGPTLDIKDELSYHHLIKILERCGQIFTFNPGVEHA